MPPAASFVRTLSRRRAGTPGSVNASSKVSFHGHVRGQGGEAGTNLMRMLRRSEST
jgi:hypothetical protein